ncbi:MAG: hypothetical protein AAGC55_27090, partial [Myxococcota bacterium]
DDFGWGPASNLGCTINGPHVDSCPIYKLNNNGRGKLFFVQTNTDEPAPDLPTQLANLDFVVSRQDPHTGAFDPPTIFSLSSEFQDSHFDPFSGYIWAEYPMGFGKGDIWVSLRRNGEWTNPINLGPDVNTEYEEQIPSASPNGRRLYYASDRPGGHGGVDLYRSRLRRW